MGGRARGLELALERWADERREAQAVLARLEAEHTALKEAACHTETRRDRLEAELSGPLDVQALRALRRAEQRLDREAVALHTRAAELGREKVEPARALLRVRAQRERALELLLERRKLEALRETRKKEQRDLDEASLSRWWRQDEE